MQPQSILPHEVAGSLGQPLGYSKDKQKGRVLLIYRENSVSIEYDDLGRETEEQNKHGHSKKTPVHPQERITKFSKLVVQTLCGYAFFLSLLFLIQHPQVFK